jgi:flagellar biosynthesis protein FliR
MFPGWTHFPEGQIVAFVLILLRMSAFVFSMPIFGSSSVPVNVKVLISIVLSVVLFPLAAGKSTSTLPIDDLNILWGLREIAVGLFLGFLMRMYFFAISVAGELIGISSGLASGQIFNPALGTSSNVIEQFETMLATLLFLALNGHYIFIQGMSESFVKLPIGNNDLNLQSFGAVGGLVKDVIIFGIKLAAPVIVSVFLAQLGLGIIGRAVPQINVFITSLQVTILLTFVVLFLAIPNMTYIMTDLMTEMAGDFMKAMKTL